MNKPTMKPNGTILIADLGVKCGSTYSSEIRNEQGTRSHTKRSLFFGVPWYRTTDLENDQASASDGNEQP